MRTPGSFTAGEYKCPECGAFLSNEGEMKNHMKELHTQPKNVDVAPDEIRTSFS